jgi:hypothetical protein
MTYEDIIAKNKDAIFMNTVVVPKYAGRWILPGSSPPAGVHFSMPTKPNWLHRTMMRVLLGWEWRDDK